MDGDIFSLSWDVLWSLVDDDGRQIGDAEIPTVAEVTFVYAAGGKSMHTVEVYNLLDANDVACWKANSKMQTMKQASARLVNAQPMTKRLFYAKVDAERRAAEMAKELLKQARG